MTVSFIPLGGFGEVGRNSLAVEIDEEIIILDLGLHLERFIELNGDIKISKNHFLRKLLRKKAVPNISLLRKKLKNVKAIVCSHAHIDHIGAIPFLAKKLACPIYATPFTAQVIRSLSQNQSFNLKECSVGNKLQITNKISIEFIRVSHSTPQSTIIAIHTQEGVIIYGNDYKNDKTPPFEKATDIKRLGELRGSVSFLILDSLYAGKDGHSPSESIARNKLLGLKQKISCKELIIATTFSSHLSRLRTLCDLADSLNREVIFMGRSLSKYLFAGEKTDEYNISQRGRILIYPKQISRFFDSLSNPKKYFLIVTGHQGEPNAILDRIVRRKILDSNDVVIFSCNTIPVEENILQREKIEFDLKQQGVEVLKDIHSSGHAWASDQLDLIKLLQPKHFVPAHGDEAMMSSSKKIAMEAGVPEEKIHFFYTGRTTVF
jgi:ribonuclease J